MTEVKRKHMTEVEKKHTTEVEATYTTEVERERQQLKSKSDATDE